MELFYQLSSFIARIVILSLLVYLFLSQASIPCFHFGTRVQKSLLQLWPRLSCPLYYDGFIYRYFFDRLWRLRQSR